MSFLFPLAWALGFLSLPVIGFYLLKTRRRRRRVSTLLFWEQLKPKIENAPLWRKLRRWLSLALQLLILLLIVAALARPAFDWETLEPQRTVFILDPSPSMMAGEENGTRWEEAVALAEKNIDRLRLEDEMALILAGDPPQILSGWTSSKRALRQALKEARIFPVETGPASALRLAREMVALRENAGILIATDTVWPSPLEKSQLAGVDFQRMGTEKAANAGFTMFAVRRAMAAPGDWQLDTELLWNGDVPFTGTVELTRNGTLMDALPVELQPGEPFRKSWRGTSEGSAEFHARLLSQTSDALTVDDIASAVLAPMRPVKVLLVSPPNPFLEAALNSIPLVEWTSAGALPSEAPAAVDLIIMNGITPPAERPQSALLLINPATSGFWGEYNGPIKESPVTEVDGNLRATRHANLRQVAIESAGAWNPAPGADVLASSLEHPLIFGRWDIVPPWMVLGFSMEESDFLLRTAFPILLSNLVEGVRSREGESKQAASLPGTSETLLKPQGMTEESSAVQKSSLLPVFPGWWMALLLVLLLVAGEWILYSRRITE